MAITGWKTPGTAASVDRDGKSAWSSPDNAKASDNTDTSCIIGKSTYGDWLRLTNFGFTVGDIPSGSTINGIEVKIERKSNSEAYIRDSALYLRKTSGQVGNNKAATSTAWTTSDLEITYGGAVDAWGASLIDTDIVSADFGIDFSAQNINALTGIVAYVDCVSIRVYYTAIAVGRSFGLIIG